MTELSVWTACPSQSSCKYHVNTSFVSTRTLTSINKDIIPVKNIHKDITLVKSIHRDIIPVKMVRTYLIGQKLFFPKLFFSEIIFSKIIFWKKFFSRKYFLEKIFLLWKCLQIYEMYLTCQHSVCILPTYLLIRNSADQTVV